VIAFGDRLRATRKAAGVSQATLDARCFLHDGEVSKLERGCRSAPGLFVILRLAAGLRVDPGILLDGLPVPQRTGGIGQAVAVIAGDPGIRTATLADKMGLPRSYVLRLVRWLLSCGIIANYQGGWALVKNADAPLSHGASDSSAECTRAQGGQLDSHSNG
jgi:transcriptional regulator with XRE-family HTH domain